MKNRTIKGVLIILGSAVLGFLAFYFGLFLRDSDLVFDSEFVGSMILYGAVAMFFLLILLFILTRRQLRKEILIADDDEKEEYVMNKVSDLIGYSSFMQLLSILIFSLTLINLLHSDGLSQIFILAGSWLLIVIANFFLRMSFKDNNYYLPDLKYFYKKNESITSYVSRLDEAQKWHVYKYCFSIVEKLKILFLAAFGIAVFVTVAFDLSLHLLLGVMTLWFIFQYITIRESKRARI
ncbi:DUF3169 family protein [Halalkalibacter alkalisediminis]|uniref:DUF3169 family protein n=1 Tax=Halalkalibacter alkalisediminis TaxID=935616 RepID=A0ABV6NEW8_9BACI|nr:DUF3169 family protein [Halalkalibacter alkalisediminis]